MRARARVLSTFVLVAVFLTAAPSTQNQLPSPSNPNLTRLGYYFVNERYGDDTAAVFPYTNLYMAIPAGYNTDLSDWQTPFRASLAKAVQHNKAIYLHMTEGTQGPPEDPTRQVFTWDAVLAVAREFWGSVVYVEVAHEERGITASTLEQKIARLNAMLDARGLARRPTVALFTREESLTTNAIQAASLSHVAIEAYQCGPGSPDPQVDIQNMTTFLANAKNRVRQVNKRVILVMMAYDRRSGGTLQNPTSDPECPMWTDMSRVAALQLPVYNAAYNDTIVSAITMFSYSRPGGSETHPILQPIHREIGSELRISPRMNVDTPAGGATMPQPFNIAGWAIDWAASSGTGVSTVHTWAYPNCGSGTPFFVGSATYGGARPDVGAAFGSQFTNSSFTQRVTGLTPGCYLFVSYALSTVSGTFNQERAVTVTAAANPAMAIDIPQNNAVVTRPFTVAGWAIDRAAASGTGVATIHIYAYPPGASPIFLGVATYGGARPDVGNLFGPQFTNSGYGLSVSNLAAGPYQIVVYAYSTVTNSFNQAQVVNVTVK